MDEDLADYYELPFPLPQKHSWRSTFRFHIEHEQFCGLRLTGIATHDVYVRRAIRKRLRRRELSGGYHPSLE